MDGAEVDRHFTEHWRTGIDKPIAVVRQEPEYFERLGLAFEDDYDDLDYLRHARLAVPSGRVFALVRHRGAPRGGTQIVTRDDSTDPGRDLAEVLAHLRLTPRDLIWAHPDVDQQQPKAR